MLSSSSFVALHLQFQGLSHFELIFVAGNNQKSSFLLQHKLLKFRNVGELKSCIIPTPVTVDLEHLKFSEKPPRENLTKLTFGLGCRFAVLCTLPRGRSQSAVVRSKSQNGDWGGRL